MAAPHGRHGGALVGLTMDKNPTTSEGAARERHRQLLGKVSGGNRLPDEFGRPSPIALPCSSGAYS